MRLARNAHAYETRCDIADAHGFPQPMPVLQGRSPTDYLRSFDLLFDHRAPQELPAVMGVGSMCRRPAGELISTLDALDRTLPARSEERRVGKECVSKCRSRWAPSD